MIKEYLSISIRILSAILFTCSILACTYNSGYSKYSGPGTYPYTYGVYRSHHNHKKDYRYGNGMEYNGYNRSYGYTGNGTYIGKVW